MAADLEKLAYLSAVYAQMAAGIGRYAPWKGEPPITEAPSWFVHLLLDGIGFVPGIGEVADLANSLLYCEQNRFFDASLSLISMLPGVGDIIAKAGRLNVEILRQLAGFKDEIERLFATIESTDPKSSGGDENISRVHGYFIALKRYVNQMRQALYSELNKVSANVSELKKAAQPVTIEEVTVVGDPNAPPEPEPQSQYGESPITPEGEQNPNWKVYLAYVEKDPNRARAAGYVELPGYGYVNPQDLPQIQARLAQGWKRAGGYGLVPPEWYNYLTQKGFV